MPEAARSVIDEAITRGITTEGLRADEKHFQELVAQRKAEIELSLDENEIIFFDRGMHDTLAYLQAYDFAVEQRVENLLNSAQYAGVFLLEPLPHFTRDYARTEDQAFVRRIHDLLAQAYTNYGMKPIPVKVASPNERVQCIIDRVKGELR